MFEQAFRNIDDVLRKEEIAPPSLISPSKLLGVVVSNKLMFLPRRYFERLPK
jgi:hypothetical protein